MHRPLEILAGSALLLAAVSLALADDAPTVVRPGSAFPGETYTVLGPAAARTPTVDLSQVLGTKPVILHYLIAGHPRAEAMFTELIQLVEETGSDSVALYGVAVPREGLDADAISARIAELGIEVPVLADEDFRIGQALRVQSVPNLTLIDAQGLMQLSNGASFKQVLGYKTDLRGAVEKLAATGKLMNYGYLERYFPVKELEGARCPDFTAPLASSSVEQQYHAMLDDSKLNLLIFWSVDCPHCRKSLPEINAWLEENSAGVNVVSAASVDDDATRTKTREFCEANGFAFPTLLDQDSRIGTMFNVTSTPTILVIRPDGVIDSAITSTRTDLTRAIEDCRRRLLKS